MDILATGKGVDQHRIVGHMRQDTQFDLRVVGREQDVAGPAGHEGTPDLLPNFRPNRDVLEVGV